MSHFLVSAHTRNTSVFIGPSVEVFFRQKVTGLAIMKDSLAIIASIVYWDDLDYNKYFYWDGAQLPKSI